MTEMSHIEKPNMQVDLEFLDHNFKLDLPSDLDIDDLTEIIEKFIFENPEYAVDLRALSKNLLNTEYYNLILKQNNTLISNFDEKPKSITLNSTFFNFN